MEKTIRALVVEPEKAPYPKEIPHNLTSLQQAVDGWIQAVYPFSEPVAIVCDDEGKLNGKPLNRALRDEDGTIYDVLAGTFLVVGAGETDFISFTPQQEEAFTARFSMPERFVRTQEGLLVLPFPPQPLPVYLQSASYAAAHVRRHTVSSQSTAHPGRRTSPAAMRLSRPSSNIITTTVWMKHLQVRFCICLVHSGYRPYWLPLWSPMNGTAASAPRPKPGHALFRCRTTPNAWPHAMSTPVCWISL